MNKISKNQSKVSSQYGHGAGQGKHVSQASAKSSMVYDKVNELQIGRNWLKGTSKDPISVEKYRKYILDALKVARDRYVQRELDQGGHLPESLMDERTEMQLRTVKPDIPDFKLEKSLFWKQSDSSLLVSCCCNSEY